MQLIPSHPLAKVLRTARVTDTTATMLNIQAARGETVSAQAVLVTSDAAVTVTAELSDLSPSGSAPAVRSAAARLQWVRYLDCTTNTLDIPADELVARAPVSIPDAFWEDAALAVDAGSVQPLWIEIDVPGDAAPGDYRGELSVRAGTEQCNLPVSLHVWDFRMPEERHQKVMQWWGFPGRGFEDIKPGTDKYWRHLERCCAFLKRHRQTEVWVQWAMVERSTATTGTAQWDASLFEKFAETVFASGLRAVIFGSVARHTISQILPDSRTEAVDDNMGRLAAVQAVIERRGWQGRVATGIADEPFIFQEETYAKVLDRVRRIAPSIRIIEAVETEQLPGLDVYVPKLSHLNLWLPYYEEIKRSGKEVWFYTCCHPQGRYPNRFLDQPLVKARALHWIGYLYGLDGFLHWGLNWFNAKDPDPYSETGRNPWSLPPGDSQVAYPGRDGFLGSLRLSALRDGLQDYEYLWTLENEMRELKKRIGSDAHWLEPRQRPLELCRRTVQSFYEHTRDPQVLLDTRAAIAGEIEALGKKPLLVVQTTPPEGTVTPVGPITINVRGIASPGAKITVNGVSLIDANVKPSGCFLHTVFMDKKTTDITVTAAQDGTTVTARRTFRLVD